jgi:hypothetical protein
LANQASFESGLSEGRSVFDDKIARKKAMSDDDRHQKAQLYATQLKGLYDKLPSLPKDSQEYSDTVNAMQSTLGEVRELFHPDNAPGALAKYGHLITDALKITNPQDRIKSAANKREKASEDDERQAQLLASSAPLSLEQVATQNAEAATAGSLASVRSGQKAFIELNPSSTPDAQQANFSQLIQKNLGSTERGRWTQISGKINGQPVTLNYDSISNRYTYPTGEAVPPEDLAPGHWVPDAKSTVFAQDQKDYEEAKKGGYKGSFEQYKAESIAKGKADVPKPLTPDQQAQAVLKKKALGQPTTKEEEATLKAAEEWINIKTTQPKIAGYQALAWSRIVSAEVPGMPGETQYVPAGIAYKNNMKAPNSLSHLMTIYYGTGKGGQDLLRFNTATHHLKMLRAAAKALDNGDIPLANQMANSYASATGKPAPTNFNAIRSAVVDEMERLYTGVGATQEGIKSMKEDVNNAQSPSQLNGYMDTDLSLMRGKIESSAQQYVMGTQGQDAFPEDIVPPAAPAVTPPSSGGNSPAKSKHYVGETVTLKNGKKLKIKIVHPDGSFE